MKTDKGILTLVATPIGNIHDCSSRMIDTLTNASIIYAEDTRVTKILLKYLGISNVLRSFHEHNARSREQEIIAELNDGVSIVIVSDAGMPCVSDPGQELVSLCYQNDITVCVIPGPSACVTALAASGLNSKRFAFEGFLPVKGSERLKLLKIIAAEPRTVIMYEAPHRIKRTLADLNKHGLGDRLIATGRELTKRYETYRRTTVIEAQQFYDVEEPRGEFTLVLEGYDEWRKRTGVSAEIDFDAIDQRCEDLAQSGKSTKEICEILQNEFNLSKNKAYQLALKIVDEQ